MTTNQSYYDILGVSNNASSTEIKIAYRNLAQQYHPDKHQDNPLSELAAEKFREIKEAYETLSNPDKRADYDRGMGNDNSHTTHDSQQPGISEVYSLIDQRLYAQAHTTVDNMLLNNKNEPTLHAIKAFIYVEQENNFSAISSFETAMEFGLQDPDSFFVYGIALIEIKKYRTLILLHPHMKQNKL